MTKQDLKNYLKMNIELTRLEEKIAALRNKIESPKNAILSNVPSGGERKDFTDYIDKLIELQEQYSERAKVIFTEQIRIETSITALEDPIERAILGYKYIDGLLWEKIIVKLNDEKKNYSWRQMHRFHAAALKNIEKI